MKRSVSIFLGLLFLVIASASAQETKPVADSRQIAPIKIATDQFAKLIVKMVPPKLQRNSPQGFVVVRIVLDREGKLKNLQPLSGNSMLIQAVAEVIQQWTFKPFLLNGEPAEVEAQFPVNCTRAGS